MTKTREYEIPLNMEYWGKVKVKAASAQELIKKLQDGDFVNSLDGKKDMVYIENSNMVDWNELATRIRDYFGDEAKEIYETLPPTTEDRKHDMFNILSRLECQLIEDYELLGSEAEQIKKDFGDLWNHINNIYRFF